MAPPEGSRKCHQAMQYLFQADLECADHTQQQGTRNGKSWLRPVFTCRQDFFYVCIGHLSDRGFCQPDAEEVAEIAERKKKEEMEREIEAVKKEYEEKQRLKKEKRKAKDKDKDKETKKAEDEEDKKDEKAKEDKVSVWFAWYGEEANSCADQGALQHERCC